MDVRDVLCQHNQCTNGTAWVNETAFVNFISVTVCMGVRDGPRQHNQCCEWQVLQQQTLFPAMRAGDFVLFSAARIAGKIRRLKSTSWRRSRERREQLPRSPENAGKYSMGAALKKSRRANSQSRLRRFESRNNRRSLPIPKSGQVEFQ